MQQGAVFLPYFLDDTACNLASINLVKYYDSENNVFDIDGYLHTILMVQLVLEATIHWGQFPTKDIARKSHIFRTTGLGLTNLGMLFMLMGQPYDSEQSRNTAAALMSILTGYSYFTSSMIAEKTGAFEAYEINKPYMLKVIANHAKAANCASNIYGSADLPKNTATINHDILSSLGFKNLTDTINYVWDRAIVHGNKFGYRNAQVSVLAPTGTIAFAMDCATTSSEPFFSHVTFKKLSGGGFIESINPALPIALTKLGYSETEIKAITDYVIRKKEKNGYTVIADGKIEGAPYLKDEHLSVFDTANKCGTGTRHISPEGHVKMMGN